MLFLVSYVPSYVIPLKPYDPHTKVVGAGEAICAPRLHYHLLYPPGCCRSTCLSYQRVSCVSLIKHLINQLLCLPALLTPLLRGIFKCPGAPLATGQHCQLWHVQPVDQSKQQGTLCPRHAHLNHQRSTIPCGVWDTVNQATHSVPAQGI